MSQPASEPAETDPPDRDTLRTHLQALAARLGKTPTVVDLHDDDECPFRPEQYVDAYGDWESALDAAGLDPADSSKQIPDHELLAELQRLHAERGAPPTCEQMRRDGAYSDRLYKDRFGSWNAALEAAMLTTNDLSERELLRELERVARDLDRVPTANEMRDHGEYRPVTYHRRFGSWRRALDEADFSRTD